MFCLWCHLEYNEDDTVVLFIVGGDEGPHTIAMALLRSVWKEEKNVTAQL